MRLVAEGVVRSRSTQIAKAIVREMRRFPRRTGLWLPWAEGTLHDKTGPDAPATPAGDALPNTEEDSHVTGRPSSQQAI